MFAVFVESKTEDEKLAERKKKLLMFIMEIRLLLNFFQVNSLLKDLPFQWKPYNMNLFSAEYFLANPFDLLYYIDCLVSSNYIFFILL